MRSCQVFFIIFYLFFIFIFILSSRTRATTETVSSRYFAVPRPSSCEDGPPHTPPSPLNPWAQPFSPAKSAPGYAPRAAAAVAATTPPKTPVGPRTLVSRTPSAPPPGVLSGHSPLAGESPAVCRAFDAFATAGQSASGRQVQQVSAPPQPTPQTTPQAAQVSPLNRGLGVAPFDYQIHPSEIFEVPEHVRRAVINQPQFVLPTFGWVSSAKNL